MDGIYYKHLVKQRFIHPGCLNFNSLLSILMNVSIRIGTNRFKMGSKISSSPGPSVLSIISFSSIILLSFAAIFFIFISSSAYKCLIFSLLKVI